MEFFGMSMEVLLKVIMIDLILSGDNAVVIALAARNVPKEHQKKAIMIGTAGAIGLRLLFAFMIVWLLKIPLITAIGGLLLLHIAYKLLVSNNESHAEGGNTMWSAVKTIVIADAVMSLDNVLALAGVAHDFMPIMIGILISIPIIIWGSRFILKAMEKFPIIIYAGAALLAYTGGEMILKDEKVSPYLHGDVIHSVLPIALTVLVVLIGYMKNKKKKA